MAEKGIRDLVEPVPEELLQGKSGRQLVEAEREFRAFTRLRQQESIISQHLQGTTPQTVGRPSGNSTISLSSTTRRTRSQGPQKTLKITIPKILQQKPGSAGESKVNVTTNGDDVSEPDVERNTVVAPRPPLSGSTVTSPSKNSRVDQSIRCAGVKAKTPTERIASLYTPSGNVRTTGRNDKMANRLTATSVKNAFVDAPPTDVFVNLDESAAGIHGSDPAMSHFLTLEEFDNEDYETIPPQERIAMERESGGAHARSRYYVDSQTEEKWSPCRVIEYNPEENTYLIVWNHNGKQKWVKRLNLIFDGENVEAWEDRYSEASVLRAQAESAIRLHLYIQSLSDEIVTPIDEDQIDRILSLVAAEFPLAHIAVIEKAVSEMREMYALGFKRSVYEYVSRDPQVCRALRPMNLPAPPTDVEPSLDGMLGTIDTPSPNYFNSRFYVASNLFSAHELLYPPIQSIIARWQLFQNHLLCDTVMPNVTRPCDLHAFEDIQSRTGDRVGERLRDDWSANISATILSDLDSHFNFYEDNEERYKVSRVSRFFSMVNLIMNCQLRSLLTSTIEAYRKFLQEYAVIYPEDFSVDEDLLSDLEEDIQERQYIATKLEESEARRKVKAQPAAPPPEPASQGRRGRGQQQEEEENPAPKPVVHSHHHQTQLRLYRELPLLTPKQPYSRRTRKMTKEINGLVPLFSIRLMSNGDSVIFDPLLEEVEDKVGGVFDGFFVYTNDVKGVGDSLFPLMVIPPVILKPLSQGEEFVHRAKADIHHVLTENMRGPRQLQQMYQCFEYILKIDPETFVEEFVNQQPPPTRQDFDDVLDRIMRDLDRIQNRSLTEVKFELIKVNCADIKASLTKKGQEICNKLQEMYSKILKEQTSDVGTKYQDMNTRIRVEPKNPEELQALKQYIDGVPQDLAKLIERFRLITEGYDLLSSYRFFVPQDDFDFYWRVFEWPRKIAQVLEDSEFKYREYKSFFQNELQENQQALTDQLNQLSVQIEHFNRYAEESKAEDYFLKVQEVDRKIKECTELSQLYNRRENLFQMAVTQWSHIKEMKLTFEPYQELWDIVYNFTTQHQMWENNDLDKVDAEEVEGKVNEWSRKINSLVKKIKEDGPRQVAESCKSKIDKFKPSLPLLKALRNPGLRQAHWKNISKLEDGLQLEPPYVYSLATLLSKGLGKHVKEVENISESASKTYQLSNQYEKMTEEWKRVQFTLEPYGDTYILKANEDIDQLLADHIMKTQGMLGSPYIKNQNPLEDNVKQWEKRLQLIQNTLDEWFKCQRTWVYLEPIFASGDIGKAMQGDAPAKFAHVNTMWRDIMRSTSSNRNVQSRCSEDRLYAILKDNNVLLDDILKQLNSFLEQKRQLFPRFYFISNEELLQILSKSNDPLRIQDYLSKCFEGINKLRFEDNLDITAMFSGEGEEVHLVKKVNPADHSNAVEIWLTSVETIMWETIKDKLKQATKDYRTEGVKRTEFIKRWAGQVVIAICSVYWTQEAEEYMKFDGYRGLMKYEEKCKQQLDDLVYLVRDPSLSKLERCTLEALVVIEVHARDIITRLVEKKVDEANAFDWQSQLRYVWEDKELRVRQTNACLTYGYEYLGNTGRLVITPLTDRCYVTLMGALHLNYGGAPEGPAGTGKTETTKDLAKAVAKQCVVYNCSDQISYKDMSKLFKGLAQSGAWGCFDEFNRIEIQVLSVIAMQVQQIQESIAIRRMEFIFDDVMIRLKLGTAVFITMNPGYAGRAELPDNLKALFRPVAMMVPNYAMIGEISLFSFGFLNGRALARKIVATYKLCSEQLSSQDHYDYGMRAVKAVLTAAGRLKRLYPNEREDILMLRSIQDVNLPKFLHQDATLFQGIISDLFPGVELPAPDYDNMRRCMLECAHAKNLQPTDYFFLKCFQTYEMIVVRHGMMLVGLSYGGKTCALHTLAETLSRLSQEKLEERTRLVTINPKSITMNQLYGKNDVSGDWSDGVLANAFRVFSQDNSPDRKWLVLDGPVDAIWIENMNTVLDDNKKLCLTNGDIIPMSLNMNMIFECENLAVASPATVSRCGMVYLEPDTLGYECLIESWKGTIPAWLRNTELFFGNICGMLETFMAPCLEYVRKNATTAIPQGNSVSVASFLRLFTTYLEQLDEAASKEGNEREATIRIEGGFLMSLIWSVGGCIWADKRQEFNIFTLEILSQASKSDKYKPSISPPEKRSLYDSKFNFKDLKFVDWLDGPGNELNISEGMQYHEIIVPTTDTARYTAFVLNCIENEIPCLLVGHTGTGKTIMVKQLLMNIDKPQGAPPPNPDGGPSKPVEVPQRYLRLFIQFSAQTSANQTQDLVDSSLKPRRKGVLAPPIGKRMLIFVDDMNMPMLEEYGAQPPIELLRQWFDFHGWYNHSKESVAFKEILDVQYIGAMGPSEGGRNPITARFTRHFNTVTVPAFDDATMKTIFLTLAEWIMTRPGFPSALRATASSLVQSTLDLYQILRAKLKPTPDKSHYTFNLRDVSKVFQGISMATPSKLQEPIHMYRLWIHESFRVFADRFINEEDRDWFKGVVNDTAQSQFKMSYRQIVTQEPLIYADFMDMAAETRPYSEVDDIEAAKAKIEDQLEDFNSQTRSGAMNLVIFNYVIEHVSRITRILRQPYGHALLVGVGGSGRQSCTKLASHICEYEIFQIAVAKNYGLVEFRDDMKKLLLKCSLSSRDMRPICFMISDSQITEESFLEDICALLNTGEIPNLFVMDEVDQIFSKLEKVARELGRESSRDAVFAYFIERCRIFVHVVMCFSPVGAVLRQRILKFPSLVNCTTIDWFREWPADGLRAVAMQFLNSGDDAEDSGLDADMKASVMECFSHFHAKVRDMTDQYRAEARQHVYVTPTSYLELITTFKSLLGKKRAELLGGKHRYDNGLEQLKKTQEEVDILKQDLAVMRPELKIKLKETDELIAVIAKESEEVGKIKDRVAKEEASSNEVAEKAKAIRDKCEGVLAQAEPELLAAQDAVKKIDRRELGELRGMGRPPDKVKLVMEGVCIMLRKAPVRKVEAGKPATFDYWETSKQLLFDISNFLDSMINYPIDELTEAVVEKVNHHTKTLHPDVFDPKAIQSVSKACVGLVMWVTATEKYYQINKIVKPMKADLAVADMEFETAMKELSMKKQELQIVNEQLATKMAHLDREKESARKLEEKVQDTDNKIRRAGILIDGLKGEKQRYTEESERLGSEFSRVLGDVVVASGVVGYLGPFQNVYRQKLITDWVEYCVARNIPGTKNFHLTKFLGEPVKIQAWRLQGLPSDAFSSDNAVIMTTARRWPLFVDPQQQASSWIKRMERDSKLLAIKPTDHDYIRHIAAAVRGGIPVLLENVEEDLDPVLEPLILKQFIKDGRNTMIMVGDMVDYNPKFRLYITTKLPRPHYKPEVSTKVQLINFLITPSGLEDQLLAKVVLSEKRELEEKKQLYVRESALNAAELKAIEDRVLAILGSEGNLLDNEDAISELGKAQTVSEKVNSKQKEIENFERICDKTRNQFVPVAKLASGLFFCVAELANIDPMYQYSLQFYIDLFWKSLQESEKTDNDVKLRIENITKHFQYSLYKNICRSLFVKDQQLFSFIMALKIVEEDPSEVRWLATGGLDQEKNPPNPCPDWLPDPNWKMVVKASTQVTSMTLFEKTFRDKSNAAFWKKLFDSESPHLEVFPEELASFSGLKRLIVMRCLRLDKLVNVVVTYVKEKIGQQYTEAPLFKLDEVYDELTSIPTQWIPIILVLSPGSNPVGEFDSVAESKGMTTRNKKLSLGQGQDKPAKENIEEGKKIGNWVLLQNCHLFADFMPSLARIVENYSKDDVRESIHRDYRLWLTSMPSDRFPVSILQNGVKLIQEPPKGLRANLLRSYVSDPINDLKFFNGCHTKPQEFHKLLFGLCFFHSLVQERRGFGPLGWNRPYEFNDTDMRISVRQLQMFLNEPKEIPYEALLYLTGHCNYGGRVTDDWDRRCLMAMLGKFYTQSILLDDYTFSPSGKYLAPAEGPPESYTEYISKLPQEQRPEVFGFHNNADITKDEREARQLLESTLQTQPRESSGGSSGGKGDPKQVVYDLVKETAGRIPNVFNVESVMEKYPITYHNSMNTVLIQELLRYNKLVGIVHKSLSNLQKAIKGEIVMSGDLEQVYAAFFDNKIPAPWLKKSFPSLKPLGAYISDLVARLNFFNQWIDNGEPPVFWISGFFFTQSFLTGVMQNYARKKQIEIDMLVWDYTVMKESTLASQPEDGAYVHGLFLEGAAWDAEKGHLCESTPKVLYVNFPIMYLKPCLQGELSKGDYYECPVYKTLERRGTLSTTGHSTNFVMVFMLPRDSSTPETHWVIRGAALFTQLDY